MLFTVYNLLLNISMPGQKKMGEKQMKQMCIFFITVKSSDGYIRIHHAILSASLYM